MNKTKSHLSSTCLNPEKVTHYWSEQSRGRSCCVQDFFQGVQLFWDTCACKLLGAYWKDLT